MTFTRTTIHYLVIIALWSFASASYAATCVFGSGSGNLGAHSSFTVASSVQSVTVPSGYACSGSVLSLLGTNETAVKIGGSTNNMHLRSNTGAQIPYRLCKSAGCNDGVFSTNNEVVWSATTLLGLLGLFNASGGMLPITISTIPSNVPAGMYTDSVTLNWRYEHCTVGVASICVSTVTGGGTTTINITMEVKKDCYINDAPDVNFGVAPMPSQFTEKSSTITTRCTLGTTYSVKLTSSNPVAGNWRQMAASVNGSTYYLQYQLKKDASNVWTHLSDFNSTGTGNPQLIPFTAGVNTAQPNLPAGNYKDVVTVTLTY